jgi:hypothetical protein
MEYFLCNKINVKQRDFRSHKQARAATMPAVQPRATGARRSIRLRQEGSLSPSPVPADAKREAACAWRAGVGHCSASRPLCVLGRLDVSLRA